MSASHGLGWPPRDDAEGWQKSPIRVGRATNNLGARRDRVFFTRHSGVTKISVQLVSEIPSMATAVGSLSGSLGNHSDHSSQRFGGVEERPTTEQNRKDSQSLFMDFVQRQASLHPAQACHHLKRSRSGAPSARNWVGTRPSRISMGFARPSAKPAPQPNPLEKHKAERGNQICHF